MTGRLRQRWQRSERLGIPGRGSLSLSAAARPSLARAVITGQGRRKIVLRECDVSNGPNISYILKGSSVIILWFWLVTFVDISVSVLFLFGGFIRSWGR